jgi:hypothetical protein
MVIYEWDCETVANKEHPDYGEDDVIDHAHGESFKDVRNWSSQWPPGDGERHELVLVRDDDDGRTWAYLHNGKLPEFFIDAYGVDRTRVPKRFHAEVERAA